MAPTRTGHRFGTTAALMAAIGLLAGCSSSRLNAVPALPQAPVQSAVSQYNPTHVLQVVRGHIRPQLLRAPLVGTLPPQQKLHLAIGLPLRDPSAVRAIVDGISDRHSGMYHRYLSPAEFENRFSPTSSDYQSAIGFAQASGFTVTGTYPGRVVIDVEATVATIQRAFHLTMQTRRRADGTLFYAPSNEPKLALRTPILHIAGLDNEQLPRPATA